jgi:antirestriction protein ArdC
MISDCVGNSGYIGALIRILEKFIHEIKKGQLTPSETPYNAAKADCRCSLPIQTH